MAGNRNMGRLRGCFAHRAFLAEEHRATFGEHVNPALRWVMRIVWYVVIAAGVIALVWALRNAFSGTTPAPLNASGYTYPSSPGA